MPRRRPAIGEGGSRAVVLPDLWIERNSLA